MPAPTVLSFEEADSRARARGGRVRRTGYGDQRKLVITCRHGHDTHLLIRDYVRGRWCRRCSYRDAAARRMLSFEEAKARIERDGYRVLTREIDYRGTQHKVRIRCPRGHEYEATPSHAFTTRCRRCKLAEVANGRRGSFGPVDDVIGAKGGRRLTLEYRNRNTKIDVECANGHQFPVTPNKLLSGSWCPKCARGLGERYCRAVFEAVFEAPFPSTRPTWLVNAEGQRLELDGYNSDLGLAFEHHGDQHFRRVKHYHTAAGFTKRQRDDRRKKRLCRQHGVRLVTIRQVPTARTTTEIVAHIRAAIRRARVVMPTDPATLDIPTFSIHSPQLLAELHAHASCHGGRVDARSYRGVEAHYEWECAVGHRWRAVWSSVKGGSWCPRCARSQMCGSGHPGAKITEATARAIYLEYHRDGRSHAHIAESRQLTKALVADVTRGRAWGNVTTGLLTAGQVRMTKAPLTATDRSEVVARARRGEAIATLAQLFDRDVSTLYFLLRKEGVALREPRNDPGGGELPRAVSAASTRRGVVYRVMLSHTYVGQYATRAAAVRARDTFETTGVRTPSYHPARKDPSGAILPAHVTYVPRNANHYVVSFSKRLPAGKIQREYLGSYETLEDARQALEAYQVARKH